MTPENFDTVLRTLVERRPYRVVSVELHGGRRFEIDFPNAVVFRDGIGVCVAPGRIPVWFDHTSVNQIIDDPANALPSAEGHAS